MIIITYTVIIIFLIKDPEKNLHSILPTCYMQECFQSIEGGKAHSYSLVLPQRQTSANMPIVLCAKTAFHN